MICFYRSKTHSLVGKEVSFDSLQDETGGLQQKYRADQPMQVYTEPGCLESPSEVK